MFYQSHCFPLLHSSSSKQRAGPAQTTDSHTTTKPFKHWVHLSAQYPSFPRACKPQDVTRPSLSRGVPFRVFQKLSAQTADSGARFPFKTKMWFPAGACQIGLFGAPSTICAQLSLVLMALTLDTRHLEVPAQPPWDIPACCKPSSK